jgi:ribosomal-protein-serine acetyltransferase
MEPPETIEAGDLTLRRWQPGWAEAASEAVRESLPQLKPFLPWAHDDYTTADSQAYLELSSKNWTEGTAFNYAIFNADDDLIGSIGLMTRMGPGVLEMGYWLRTSQTGHGHMTTAVIALTQVAHELPGIDSVAIRHDAANLASAAVATKAGFVESDRITREPQAPGETGTDIIRKHRR